ncbi:MAG: polyprenyl synthetase family protein [Bacillus sp. (in: firmicutes)]
MKTSFPDFMERHKKMIETGLVENVDRLCAPEVLKEAMKYSLQAGGKRIRPMLVFAVLDAFGKQTEAGIETACAIEMIHTYSLIHDDLPSMDDDELRRGKPTNHIVFGEANAILAGDALLTLSFDILSSMDIPGITADQKLELIAEISKSAGPEGMVGGQIADMESEDKTISIDYLEYIHRNKTGKLLSASVLSGAILAGAREEQKESLKRFAGHLGLAFQIRDDILDIEGTEEKIGKPVGSDAGNAKSTYPALLSLEGAKEKLKETTAQAIGELEGLGFNNSLLMELTNLIAIRES